MISQNKIFIFFVLMPFTACDDKFDYSPYTIDFSDKNRNINQRNIEKLLVQVKDGKITIAFTGDTHRFYNSINMVLSE